MQHIMIKDYMKFNVNDLMNIIAIIKADGFIQVRTPPKYEHKETVYSDVAQCMHGFPIFMDKDGYLIITQTLDKLNNATLEKIIDHHPEKNNRYSDMLAIRRGRASEVCV